MSPEKRTKKPRIRRPIPDKREQVTREEMDVLRNLNEMLLRGILQEKAASFRMLALNILQKHDAVHKGSGWVIFDINTENDGSVTKLDEERYVLLLVDFDEVYKTRPLVRVITNQQIQLTGEIENKDAEPQFMTWDFMIDSNNNAQYYLSATDDEDYDESFGARFEVNEEGELGLSCNTTTVPPLGTSRYGSEYVHPFGHFSNPNDSLYALSLASTILEDVTDKLPLYVNQGN